MSVKKTESRTEALLETAKECFDLAVVQQRVAAKQHDSAARQLDLARKQQTMGETLHQHADEIEHNSKTIKAIGKALQTDAEISGQTDAEISDKERASVPEGKSLPADRARPESRKAAS